MWCFCVVWTSHKPLKMLWSQRQHNALHMLVYSSYISLTDTFRQALLTEEMTQKKTLKVQPWFTPSQTDSFFLSAGVMWNSRPLQKILSESCSTCSGVRDDPCFSLSAPPLPCADPDLSACSPLNSLLGLFESHTGEETGICRIKDFDWLSGAALESSEVMGGKNRGEKTDGETLRPAEKIMN